MTMSQKAKGIVTGVSPSVGAPMDRHQGGAVGAPLDRVDGRLKVTGAARYAAEFPTANVAHAVIVTSTVAGVPIPAFDTKAAEAAPGVIRVMTHLNAPKLPMKAN